MKTSLIASLALLSAPLFAQVYTPQPPNIRQPRAPQPQSEVDPSAGLNRNITIRLEGEVVKDLKVNIAITGTGPKWVMDQVVGDDGSVLTCEYQVEEKDGGFRVTYSVGVRVAIPSSRPAVPVPGAVPGQPQPFQPGVSISYRDCMIRGAIACRLGEPVEILRNGTQRVQLTLADPAAVEIVPPPPGKPRE